MSNEVTYNGYVFNDYSHVTVRAEMVYDDSGRTVTYHKYVIRVDSIITAESGDSFVGDHFRRIRQKLTKPGRELKLNHSGFGPAISINGAGTMRDVAFGPKPKVLDWSPVGATNAVEVVWECEFCVPTCDGDSNVRYDGIAAMNYSVMYRIDRMGYTTRTIAGYLEIAMSRIGVSIPDTADAYRDLIAPLKPDDYHRETEWNLSPDKRRLDFVITDTQVQSPNKYPPGIVEIRARHRVGWSKRDRAALGNTISASITLLPDQPRGRAWQIFRAIVADRVAYASGNKSVFLEGLEVEEELYGEGQISFSLVYRVIGVSVADIFSSSGVFQPTQGDWQAWSQSTRLIQSRRGISQLANSDAEDQLVDLCTGTLNTVFGNPYYLPGSYPTPLTRLCNDKPPPNRSYIRFEGWLSVIDDNPAVEQITVGEDDLVPEEFDPSEPAPKTGTTDQSKDIERFIESAAPGMEFEWIGYAERVGYDIPRPGKLKFGNVTLIRKGESIFRKKFLGTYFCQPVYGAAWRVRYVVDQRPPTVEASESDPVFNETTTGANSPAPIPGPAT